MSARVFAAQRSPLTLVCVAAAVLLLIMFAARHAAHTNGLINFAFDDDVDDGDDDVGAPTVEAIGDAAEVVWQRPSAASLKATPTGNPLGLLFLAHGCSSVVRVLAHFLLSRHAFSARSQAVQTHTRTSCNVFNISGTPHSTFGRVRPRVLSALAFPRSDPSSHEALLQATSSSQCRARTVKDR
jgi:hypothetical protein